MNEGDGAKSGCCLPFGGPQQTLRSVTQWGCATEWATGCPGLAGLEDNGQERLWESEQGPWGLREPRVKGEQ